MEYVRLFRLFFLRRKRFQKIGRPHRILILGTSLIPFNAEIYNKCCPLLHTLVPLAQKQPICLFFLHTNWLYWSLDIFQAKKSLTRHFIDPWIYAPNDKLRWNFHGHNNILLSPPFDAPYLSYLGRIHQERWIGGADTGTLHSPAQAARLARKYQAIVADSTRVTLSVCSQYEHHFSGLYLRWLGAELPWYLCSGRISAAIYIQLLKAAKQGDPSRRWLV